MRDDGYEIKYGNSERYGMYMAVRNSEMQRFEELRRGRRLHAFNDKEAD